MRAIPVIVIGAGQAGLAVSHLLTRAGVDHVVLERGRTAQRWDSYSWESLRLLTPNWLSRLPGYQYTGPEPAGFMSAADVANYLRHYAEGAPIVEGAEVRWVRDCGGGYRVAAGDDLWSARAVVVATGWCDLPRMPVLALDTRIEQLTPAAYQSPATLPHGGVLVVGASTSGVQLADDLADTTRRADARLVDLLRRVDAFARTLGLARETEDLAPIRAARTKSAVSALDLRQAGVGVVIWATGYRRAYPWLHVPVLDQAGEIRHRGGVTPAPGLFVVGMRWQSRRNSPNLDGVRHDAVTVVARVLEHVRAGSHMGEAAA